MVMDTMQVRLNREMIRELEELVKQGKYSNRGEAVRDAVRRFIWSNEVGTVKNNQQNSVREVKKARKELEKQEINLNEINNL